MIKNKVDVEVAVDGRSVKFVVKKPDAKQRTAAQIVEAKAFRDAVKGGAILRENLVDVMEEQGLLDDDKQTQLREIQERVEANLRKVPDEKGRVKDKNVTREDAKNAAIRLRADRVLMQLLSMDRVNLEARTAEGLADNAKFDYLVSVCTIDDQGEAVFESVEDYQERANRDDPVAIRAANVFAYLYRGLDQDYQKNLPENKYLESIGWFNEAAEEKVEEETFELMDDTPPAVDDTPPAVDDTAPAADDSPAV